MIEYYITECCMSCLYDLSAFSIFEPSTHVQERKCADDRVCCSTIVRDKILVNSTPVSEKVKECTKKVDKECTNIITSVASIIVSHMHVSG